MCSLSSAVRRLPAVRAVVRLDRVADVDLVGQQARLGGLQIGQPAGEADDRQARPGDVVLPQLAHRVVEGELARRQRMRRGCVTVGADEGFVMGARRMRLVGTGRGHRERRARQRDQHDRRGRDATPPQSFNRFHEGSLLAARALAPPLGWQRWRAAMRPAACTPWVSRPIASTGSTCASSGASPTVLLSE